MSDSDSSNSSLELPRKKYKNKNKVFQTKWLGDSNFCSWLQANANDETKARCRVCNILLQCGKSELTKHMQTVKHKKCMTMIKSTNKIDTLFKKKETSEERNIKSFEIALSAFFAEHNVALSAIDHLTPLLQKYAVDSDIIKRMRLGSTKCTNIVRNVLEPFETDKLVSKLKESHFSILVDESTDISNKKYLCLVVRYIDNSAVRTRLLELLELDAKNCSSEVLFSAVRDCFVRKGIRLSNIIGVASDGAAVMVGKHNSFFSKLKDEVPDVILFKCICHTSAIISSKACAELPRSPEDLVRNIATYVSGSAKRCAELLEFQEYFNASKKKILKLSSTRWLSMHSCVTRILENWDVLNRFFQLAAVEDHLKSASNIIDDMNNPLNKSYLLFLSYVLNYFNSFNALFQSRNMLIHELYQRSLTILKQISQNFIKSTLLHDIINVNIRNPHNYLALEDINLGYECNDYLRNILPDFKVDLRKKCLSFYIVAVDEMQKRLPLQDFYKELQMLSPKCALDSNNSNIHKVFPSICLHFKNFVSLKKIEFEWQSLPFLFNGDKLNELRKSNVDTFWSEIHNSKNEMDLKFPELTKLTKILLVLPHSNAECERIFSIVTDCKPKKRNRLGSQTLNAMAVFRSSLQANNMNCASFENSGL